MYSIAIIREIIHNINPLYKSFIYLYPIYLYPIYLYIYLYPIYKSFIYLYKYNPLNNININS